MPLSEICKDGLRIRLVREEERLYLQVLPSEVPEESRADMMSCDPDVLCSVVRGMTYQLASATSYCVVRREGDNVLFECQHQEEKKRCLVPIQEFAKLVAPVMPHRLRAMLL